MFVNRVSELARLDRWWNSEQSRLGVVWGRRRVGKTSLIRHFADGKASVFHTGAGRGALAELAMLSRNVMALDHGSITRDLAARPFRDWDEAFDHCADWAKDRPLLLVLDEFPELAATSPELPNVIRAFTDRAAGRTQLRILVAGSAVRYMAALGEERQPLYGRMDISLQLQAFQPAEAALMLRSLPPSERAAVYGLLGGIPLYLSWWDQNGTLAENLSALACEPGARLLTEGDLVMATEAESGEYPAAVLHAVAGGKTRHNEIKDIVGAEPTRTLERLIDLKLLERVQPVTESGTRTRNRRYRIADNFLAFHLGLLGRFRGEIDAGLGDAVLAVLMESLDDHLGMPWEAAFRAHLRTISTQGALGDKVVAVGSWWSRDGRVEIDAVALSGRSRTPIAVGEAKWARTVDGRRLAAQLRAKSAAVPGMVEEPLILLAARDAVTSAPDGVLIVRADDIFA